MRFGGHDPQLGEPISLCPLDSSSRDTQSRRRIAGLFLGVFHWNALLDTNIKLGIDPAIQFPRLIRRDLRDTPIGLDCVRRSESKCDDAYGFQSSPPVYEVGKGLISLIT